MISLADTPDFCPVIPDPVAYLILRKFGQFISYPVNQRTMRKAMRILIKDGQCTSPYLHILLPPMQSRHHGP